MTVTVLANIDVPDLERACDFYCAALDLAIGRRFGESAVELLGASTAIYLLRNDGGTVAAGSPSAQRDYARHWTPVHLDFVVSDIDAAVARARAAGARLERGTESQRWGRIATLADPFGHGFCLIEFLGKGYDEIAT